MANKKLRAMLLGGNSHLEIIAVERLVADCCANPGRSLQRWNGGVGPPVLRRMLVKLGRTAETSSFWLLWINGKANS